MLQNNINKIGLDLIGLYWVGLMMFYAPVKLREAFSSRKLDEIIVPGENHWTLQAT